MTYCRRELIPRLQSDDPLLGEDKARRNGQRPSPVHALQVELHRYALHLYHQSRAADSCRGIRRLRDAALRDAASSPPDWPPEHRGPRQRADSEVEPEAAIKFETGVDLFTSDQSLIHTQILYVF